MEADLVLLDYAEKRISNHILQMREAYAMQLIELEWDKQIRIFGSGNKVLTKADLVTIQSEDILKSRLFIDS